MIVAIAFVTALSLGAQEDRSGEIHSWIDKLRSERIEERDRAMQELQKLGPAAVPELEKAARGNDAETAARARTLIRRIRMKEIFGIEVKDLNDLPLSTLVEWMEKKTGRKFLFAEDLGLRNKRVRVQEDLLEVGDAYAVGVELLRIAHVGVAPSQAVPGAVELFPSPLGGKMGLKVYQKVDELPRANEFCTLVLHPKHASPRTVQAVLINMVSFPQNCLSEESSGTVVLSDYASVLRKCAEIMNGLDVARAFRVSVALLEGRTGKEASVPEAFRDLKLVDATGLNQFTLRGTASSRLERVLLQNPQGGPPSIGKSVHRFPGAPPLVVEYSGSVRAAGGPTLDRFSVQQDLERAPRLFEAQFTLQDERWTFVGVVPQAEGGSLVILARAVPD